MELTAAEASARLGVKRSTLYAYVSRGLLHRHVAMDGRTSLFDSDEVDPFGRGDVEPPRANSTQSSVQRSRWCATEKCGSVASTSSALWMLTRTTRLS